MFVFFGNKLCLATKLLIKQKMYLDGKHFIRVSILCTDCPFMHVVMFCVITFGNMCRPKLRQQDYVTFAEDRHDALYNYMFCCYVLDIM